MPKQSSVACVPGLVAKNISRSFKDNLAVKEASLRVDCGQVVGLIGPNGAGKSTCFGMLSELGGASACSHKKHQFSGAYLF